MSDSWGSGFPSPNKLDDSGVVGGGSGGAGGHSRANGRGDDGVYAFEDDDDAFGDETGIEVEMEVADISGGSDDDAYF